MPAVEAVRMEVGRADTLPEMPPSQSYPYIGHRRRADLKDKDELAHVRKCVCTVAGKLRQAGLGRHEWTRAVRERVVGLMAHHGAMCAALSDFDVADRFDRMIRGAYRHVRKTSLDSPNYDLYAYHGWVHSSAEAAGALYSTVCALLASPVPSPAASATQSVLGLVLYMWGCMEPPLH